MGLESPEAAAAGIVDIVNENMLGGLRLVSVQQGFDPRDFALVAFGGAGPLHANALGRLTGAWPVIVPPSPGVLCALGDATTSRRDESARTVLRRFADLDRRRARARCCASSPTRPAQRLAEQGAAARAADGRLPGRRPLPRAGLRDPGRRRPDRLDDRRCAGRSASASTPSTTGCSPSCSTSTTSWSTPAPRSPGPTPDVAPVTLDERRRRPVRRARAGAPDLRRRRARAGRRLRPRAAARRRRGRAARRSSPRWTPRPSSCPGTRPPCTPSGRLLITPLGGLSHGTDHRDRDRHASSRSTSTRSPSTSSRTGCATPATRWTRCCSAPRCRRASASSTTSSR